MLAHAERHNSSDRSSALELQSMFQAHQAVYCGCCCNSSICSRDVAGCCGRAWGCCHSAGAGCRLVLPCLLNGVCILLCCWLLSQHRVQALPAECTTSKLDQRLL